MRSPCFSGQRFAFHGYIRRDRTGHIKEMAQRAADGETQLFMDAPYRNQATLDLNDGAFHR